MKVKLELRLDCSRLQRCLRVGERELKERKEDGKKPVVCSIRRDKMQCAEGNGITRGRR